jgi:broad specificity phosphatase PhoE
MSRKVHLVRHAEGLHNLRNDTTIPDAPLSERGLDLAEDLGRRFIHDNSDSVGAVLVSPLRRAIQTSLAALPRVLSAAHYPANSGKGVRTGGVTLVLDPDLQEISTPACNVGSPPNELLAEFPGLEAQIRGLPPRWLEKTGPWSPARAAVAQRKIRILQRLWDVSEQLRAHPDGREDIVVVTHEGVMVELVPGANVPLGAYRTFTLIKTGTDVVLQ